MRSIDRIGLHVQSADRHETCISWLFHKELQRIVNVFCGTLLTMRELRTLEYDAAFLNVMVLDPFAL